LSTPVIEKLIRDVIDDLKGIAALSPFPASETDIKPDRQGERCGEDRKHVADWYLKDGKKILGGIFDDQFSPGEEDEKKAGYIYGMLQRLVWQRLGPARSTYTCLLRIRG
jgi:hypothetical protein